MYKMPYIFPSVVGPIAFCNIVGTEEEDEDESLKGSKRNVDEARKAVSCRLSILQFSFSGEHFPIHCRWSWLRLLVH